MLYEFYGLQMLVCAELQFLPFNESAVAVVNPAAPWHSMIFNIVKKQQLQTPQMFIDSLMDAETFMY